MVCVWVSDAPVIGRLDTIFSVVAAPPPPPPPQAASSMLAATNTEIKTNKRLDISYSSEFVRRKYNPPRASEPAYGNDRADNALQCRHHLLGRRSVRLIIRTKPQKYPCWIGRASCRERV